MKPKHTPGPWSVDDKSNNHAVEIVTNAIVVCQVGKGDVRASADSRLIAASPDLLQAAKDSLEYMDAAVGDLTMEGLDGSDVIIEALNDLRARVAVAIAKAEREQE